MIQSSGTEFEPGDMIAGRYKVLSLIGRGATGSVYAVEQVLMKKRFAVKTLSASMESTVWQRRFQKESQAASKLDHANIVRAVDFGVDDGRLFLVMEFVDGQTLSQHLKELGRLPVEEALKIFIPVSFAVGYAHQQGVIHRDIKPSNIILEKCDGGTAFVPKIVDFGIAKLAEEAEAEGLTKTGEVFGTPLYMSPEQCSGIKVDHRSDIYSLGCVLYESLTGAPPFCAQTALETMMQHRTGPVPPLAEASLGLNFPPALESIVQKMLAKEPDNRYASCLRLADDLILAQRGEAVAAPSPPASSTSKVPPHRLPFSRLYLLLPIFVIASVALLTYILRPQQVSRPNDNATSEPALLSTAGRGVSFCEGDVQHGRTFHFGIQRNDPTYTWNSAIGYVYPKGEFKKNAAGNIPVPPGCDVEFRPSQWFTVDHPTLFSRFRRGDIQMLTCDFGEYQDVEPGPFNTAMAYVGDLKDLKELRFKNVPLNADGLANLKLNSMQSLTFLYLIRTQVDGNDLSHLQILGKLKLLEFSFGKNASALLKTLKVPWHTSDRGRSLFLRYDRLSDADLSMIAECDLANLDIRNNPHLTDDGLRQLLKQKRLEALVLDGQQFDRAILQLLASKTRLAILQVALPKEKGSWTKEEKEHLVRSLPHCNVVFTDVDNSTDGMDAK